LKDAFQANSKSTPKAADKSVRPTQPWDEQRHRIRHRSNVGASVPLVRKLPGLAGYCVGPKCPRDRMGYENVRPAKAAGKSGMRLDWRPKKRKLANLF
jgi:hypothetical protein